MLKKILFSLLSMLITYSVCVAAYRIYEPREEFTEKDSSSYISYASLKEYIVSAGESSEHLLLFYSPYDSDSEYVRSTLLNEVAKRTSLDISSMIEIVDVSGVRSENLMSALSDDWGLSNYPSFAFVHLENNEPGVISKLEWSSSSPLTSQSIITWLHDNGITE